jgi:hypothetical protein
MPVQLRIREVFGYFQNLNLLGLIQDLRRGQMARGAWSSNGWLCPVAHGLPAGRHVQQLVVLGQAADLSRGCDYAARQLGADPAAVFRFVRTWDDEPNYCGWLLGQLEELWEERLADADAVQEVIQIAEPAEVIAPCHGTILTSSLVPHYHL